MKRTLQGIFLAVFAAEALVVGQSADAQRVLAGLREALGGDAKLAAVKSVAIEGQKTNSTPDGTSASAGFEMAFELAGATVRYVKKEELANLGGTVIARRSGFNGAELIEEVDAPPAMTAGGGMRVMRMSPGGPMPGGQATPEQVAAQKAQLMVTNRRDFARLALGMFGTTPAYPVEFTYAGQAEAPDGKADVLDVKGADGFTAKLFVDGKSHLPLMLMWMDKEPLRMVSSMGGAAPAVSHGNMQVFAGSGSATPPTPEEIAKRQEEMAVRVKEADAKRKTVEYRIIYADYKSFDGVRMPTRIQRMMDGLATEELTFDRVKVNAKIDASKFAPTKNEKSDK